jgi:hypothetical protein
MPLMSAAIIRRFDFRFHYLRFAVFSADGCHYADALPRYAATPFSPLLAAPFITPLMPLMPRDFAITPP